MEGRHLIYNGYAQLESVPKADFEAHILGCRFVATSGKSCLLSSINRGRRRAKQGDAQGVSPTTSVYQLSMLPAHVVLLPASACIAKLLKMTAQKMRLE